MQTLPLFLSFAVTYKHINTDNWLEDYNKELSFDYVSSVQSPANSELWTLQGECTTALKV